MSDTPRERRLTKREVEVLMATYDTEPVPALTQALARLLERGDATFDEVVRQLADDGRISPERYLALSTRDVDALDALARDLNEIRTLPS